MRKRIAAFGSGLFFLLAPVTVAGVIPWVITGWAVSSANWPQTMSMPFAAVLMCCSLISLLDSFGRFVLQGFGTPTPLLPTKVLIVSGLYRHVRNPMYLAVLSLILGQALWFGSLRLGLYGGVVWVIFHTSVLVYEEPRLREDYAVAFDAYCQNVRRWLPRLKPWRSD